MPASLLESNASVRSLTSSAPVGELRTLGGVQEVVAVGDRAIAESAKALCELSAVRQRVVACFADELKRVELQLVDGEADRQRLVPKL